MGWGDELMVTGRVRVLQQRDPRKVRVVYERPRWHEAWDGNPRIAALHEQGDFQELLARRDYLRPYTQRKGTEQWIWQRYQPPRGEIYFTAKERAFGERAPDRVVIEPNIKAGASPNKDWGWERWVELARLMRAAGVVPTQLGNAMTRRLQSAEFIETNNMRYAAAVLARARAAVLPEGGLHHVCAAVETPAVVIFGGFISPEVTGYQGQMSIFPGTGLGCGMRRTCAHCAAAMAAISPEQVLKHLMEILNATSRRSVAA